ncbi:hypothetical protein Q8A67_023975 [Cirrhinus molitorella]|uniref:Uncharacterized protein n=1 Tax=Cirrhinus molitorella TaxID=172907 RepID=A0AA88TER6_9TELE|nr:hypothetical protein Q8A67_023975 [Cirrhinus molitorella]
MAADTEMTASSATACNGLIDSCHDYYGPEEKVEFSVLSVEDFPSLPSTPLKPPPKRGCGVACWENKTHDYFTDFWKMYSISTCLECHVEYKSCTPGYAGKGKRDHVHVMSGIIHIEPGPAHFKPAAPGPTHVKPGLANITPDTPESPAKMAATPESAPVKMAATPETATVKMAATPKTATVKMAATPETATVKMTATPKTATVKMAATPETATVKMATMPEPRQRLQLSRWPPLNGLM